MIVELTVIDREGHSHPIEVPTDMGLSLMEVCKAYELPVEGTCGGMALCASCHIYIETDYELGAPSYDEEAMLDQAFHVLPNSRLGCQIAISEALNGIVVRLAPEA